MIVFLNGEFVPEEQARISIFDRGFLYGDGVFETLRVSNGVPFRWFQHLQRLQSGLQFLKIPSSFSNESLFAKTVELVRRNRLPESVMRLTVSRGKGLGGYSPRGADSPTLVMSLRPPPTDMGPWRLITSSVRLSAADPLAAFKTCNKLPQVLARSEADKAGVEEALVSNSEGCLVEGTSSNLFWIQKNTVFTAPLSGGVLPGVTRALVIELCQKIGVPIREAHAKARELMESEGIFLTLSSLGLVSGSELDHHPLAHSPVVDKLKAAYGELLKTETAAIQHPDQS